MKNYNNKDNPEFLNNYLVHLKVAKLLAERTINEYYLDIRLFLKYIYSIYYDTDLDIADIDISVMTESDIKKITVSDIYNFIFYSADERKNSERSRYRKISSLRSFFKYLSSNAVRIIDKDPTKDLDIGVPKSKDPKFLTLNESLKLLSASDEADSKRDYCIITLFLNCGMRLSELIGLNISDINFDENLVRVLGKGNKERTIYLNPACIDALVKYLEIRKANQRAVNEPALFISNQNKRISKRRVQQIVEKTLFDAGLDGKGITTHKLRHTAATLMYKYGGADFLTLKDVLGHCSTSTTEIYTHLDNTIVREAFEGNPLADVRSKSDDENKKE